MRVSGAPKKCVECKKMFEPSRVWQIFHNRKCRNAFHNRRLRDFLAAGRQALDRTKRASGERGDRTGTTRA